MKKPLVNYMVNGGSDNLSTPRHAFEPVVKYLLRERELVGRNLTIWESSDSGDSQISVILREYGFNVIATHIVHGENFFTYEPEDYDIIVTNPPYSIKSAWLYRCYELGKPFMLLLPLTTLEGVERGKLFRKFGISVIVLDRRISFTRNNNWFNASWFVYNFKSIGNNKVLFEEMFK